jgi:thiamine-monophosphate kinase
MNEFDLIQSYLAGLTGPEGLGLLDDVALWSLPTGVDAVFSADTLVEGVHFPKGKFDSQLAKKLLRTNISDIIAKGADPLGYMLSLTLNERVRETDIEDFCLGLAADQQNYGLQLWGGDTTRTTGPNVLSITIIGTLPKGATVKRSGANVGDIICVTGTIGDSFLGLKTVLSQLDSDFSERHLDVWRRAYHLPNPPFMARHSIRSLASSALDISDGLIADAAHVAKASFKSLVIKLDQIPLSPESSDWAARQNDQVAARIKLATGGDDYQVLLTMTPSNFDDFINNSKAYEGKLTKIGQVEIGEGVRVLDQNGDILAIKSPGYTHF